MAPNQPPNDFSPPANEGDGTHAPEAHGSSAAPAPYGTPPGEYAAGTGTDSASRPGHEPGYAQDGYQQGGTQPTHGGYQQGGTQPTHGGYQQGPPPGNYQPGYPQGYQQGYPQGYPPGAPSPYGVWPEPKSRLAAGLLGIFLGGLGIHRFYLGYTTLGIVQLLVTLFTFGFGAIWGFVEGIMILAGAQSFRTDARGVPLRE
ncbi:NINE protein [Arthrobacter gandavensis]|nr:NINE protein [Arthrobacter gandavensis]